MNPLVRPGLSESSLRVPRSRIRELAEIAMGMEGVLKLYFGESNLPTPEFIKHAAVRALEEGYTFTRRTRVCRPFDAQLPGITPVFNASNLTRLVRLL